VADSTGPNKFKWLDFADLACFLAERDDEASLRSSVSRGYYAVFHLALLVLSRHDPEFDQHRGSDSHKLVWDRLAALKRRQATTAARSGRSLADKRKKADYRSPRVIGRSSPKMRLSRSPEPLLHCPSCSTDHSPKRSTGAWQYGCFWCTT
jgi:hypothetical protein